MVSSETIHDEIFEHAEQRSSALFATVLRNGETVRLTYGDLGRRSADFAAAYAARGVRVGDRVGILLPQCAELYPAFVGAMALGAIPAILPPRSSKQDPEIFWHVQQATLQRMGAKVLVTDADGMQDLRDGTSFGSHAMLDVDALPAGAPSPIARSKIPANHTAFLQHSSGTTGLKKGVLLRHDTVLRHLEGYAKAIGLSRDDRIATWLPHYHDMGLVACFLLPAIFGIEVVCLDPFEWVLRPASLLDAMDAHRCTLAWLPNFAFHHIVRTLEGTPSWNLRHVRAFIDTSEPCKPETFELFHRALASTGLRTEALQTSYGLAENVFAVTQSTMSATPRVLVVDRDEFSRNARVMPSSSADGLRFVSCGKPLDTATVSIVGPDGVELPEGGVGEIAVAGETLFDGYYRAEAPSLRDSRFFTGDLGFAWDGELYVVGRAEDMLIINGRNLYGHEVEHAVNLHTSVKPGRCIALGVFNPSKGSEELNLVVEVAGGADDAALRRRLADVVLSATGVSLSAVHFVPPGWLIKTTSGKIARRASLEKLANASR